MQSAFSQIVFLLGVVVTAGAFLDAWIKPVKKARLKLRCRRLAAALKKADPVIVTKAPLESVSAILDRIFGPALFSWKAFLRSAILTVALLAASLTVAGLRVGVPFAIKAPPWTTFSQTFDGIELFVKEQAKQKTTDPKASAMITDWYKRVLEFRTDRVQTIYSVTFFVVVIGSAILVNYICLVLARKTLRDMAHATTLFTLFSLALINFAVSCFLYSGCVSLVCLVSFPLLWSVGALLFLCTVYVSWLLALSLAFPLVVAALKFSPDWMEIVSVVSTLPGIIVLLFSVIALAAFPFRRWIRRGVVMWLLHAVESDVGVIAFSVATFALMVALVSCIPKLLFGTLGLS